MHSRYPVVVVVVAALLLFSVGLVHADPVPGCPGFTSDAPPAYTLRYGAFDQDAEYLAAVNQGYFVQENVCVQFNAVFSSDAQYSLLLSGQYDVINSATDNIAARVGNLNLPISTIAGSDMGVLFGFVVNSNPAGPNIQTYDDLRAILATGQKPNILVDSPFSGFSYALRKILSANGFYWNNATDNNYNMLLAGGSFGRARALKAGTIVINNVTYVVHGTMLGKQPVATLDLTKEKVLTFFKDVVPSYQNNVFATTYATGDAKRPALVAFLKGIIRGAQFANDAANHATMVNYLLPLVNNNTDFAEALYQGYVDPATGTNRNSRMDRQGLRAVVTLRNEFGGFNTPIATNSAVSQFINPTPQGFYDNRFFNEAMSALSLDY